MFKRHIGTSPSGYKLAVRESRDGKFPRGEEDGQIICPLVTPKCGAAVLP